MRWSRWLCFVTLLTVALVALATLDGGSLAPPPLSLDGAMHWAATRDTTVAVFALVRVGAFVAGSYLLLAVLVGGGVAAFDEQIGRAHV